MKVLIIAIIIAVMIFASLAVYSCCVAAGKADRTAEKLLHECRWVKHYDHKRGCYVQRCPICRKTRERKW